MCIFLAMSKKGKTQQPKQQQECARVSAAPTTTTTCSSITITQEYETNHIYEPLEHGISITVDAQFDVNR